MKSEKANLAIILCETDTSFSIGVKTQDSLHQWIANMGNLYEMIEVEPN